MWKDNEWQLIAYLIIAWVYCQSASSCSYITDTDITFSQKTVGQVPMINAFLLTRILRMYM